MSLIMRLAKAHQLPANNITHLVYGPSPNGKRGRARGRRNRPHYRSGLMPYRLTTWMISRSTC